MPEPKPRKRKQRDYLGPYACPACAHPSTTVAYTQTTKYGRFLKRQRLCPSCGHKFFTYEVEAIPWGKGKGTIPLIPATMNDRLEFDG